MWQGYYSFDLQRLSGLQLKKSISIFKMWTIDNEHAFDSCQFSCSHSVVFSFRYSISEEDQPLWRHLVEFDESPKGSLHHPLQRLNDFNARLLNFGESSVSRSTLVIRKNDSRHWGFCDTWPRMTNISPWMIINKRIKSRMGFKNSPTIMNGSPWRPVKTPDSLEELQPPRRAFILGLNVEKKTCRIDQKLTLTPHCSSTDYWRPWICPIEGIESSHLKGQKTEIQRRGQIERDVPYLTSPQCLTAFRIGPALLGKITIKIKASGLARFCTFLRTFVRLWKRGVRMRHERRLIEFYTSSGELGLPRSIARGATEGPIMKAGDQDLFTLYSKLPYPCLCESK